MPEDSHGVELARALVAGTDDAALLVTGGKPLVADGSPLTAELGLELADVVSHPEDYINDEDLEALAVGWKRVTESDGHTEHGSFAIRDASGSSVVLDVVASNLTHTAMAGVLVRLRIARTSHLPSPPPSDSTWPDDPLLQKPQFMELVQRAVDRKMKRVWKLPKHARSVTRDRRCDYAVVLLNLDRYGMLRGSFTEHQLQVLMRQAAERLRRALRARDAVAHLGRSEIAMFLDGVVDASQAERVTDAYTRILEDRFEVEGESVSLSPVVGDRHQRATLQHGRRADPGCGCGCERRHAPLSHRKAGVSIGDP